MKAMWWVGCGGYVVGWLRRLCVGWVVGWVETENSAHSGPTHRFFQQVRVWQKWQPYRCDDKCPESQVIKHETPDFPFHMQLQVRSKSQGDGYYEMFVCIFYIQIMYISGLFDLTTTGSLWVCGWWWISCGNYV